MDKDFNKTLTQTACGLAALFMVLEEKGIVTEDEYKKAYEAAKKALIRETIAAIKKSF